MWDVTIVSDVNKDFSYKDQDQDKDLWIKDQDQDKDFKKFAVKDKDKDQDLTVKNKDKDKDKDLGRNWSQGQSKDFTQQQEPTWLYLTWANKK